MFSRIRDTYRRTSKAKDIFWNRFVARPLAAPLVMILERSRVTPNQITIASLAVFLVAAALLIVLPGHGGLAIAVAVIQLSYVLDCVDGQLARLRGTSSPIGAHFDFLMDELKAFVLVAAVAARLFDETGSPRMLLEGLLGLTAVASGISLTSFVRRPEYRAATGAVVSRGSGDYGDGLPPAAAAPPPRRSPLRRLIGLVESLGKFLVHYPSYLVYVAIFNRLDVFLHVYAAVNAAYAARAMLGVVLRLGRGRA
jgi:CDP-alcohol phosphatidyltransferase